MDGSPTHKLALMLFSDLEELTHDSVRIFLIFSKDFLSFFLQIEIQGLPHIKCGGCTESVVTSTEEEMEKHMKEVHPMDSEYWCDQCNYNFITEESMNRHNRMYHANQGIKARRNKTKDYKDIKQNDTLGR